MGDARADRARADAGNAWDPRCTRDTKRTRLGTQREHATRSPVRRCRDSRGLLRTQRRRGRRAKRRFRRVSVWSRGSLDGAIILSTNAVTAAFISPARAHPRGNWSHDLCRANGKPSSQAAPHAHSPGWREKGDLTVVPCANRVLVRAGNVAKFQSGAIGLHR